MRHLGPVLGIETSCDETAIAVYDPARGLLSHTLHSQVWSHHRRRITETRMSALARRGEKNCPSAAQPLRRPS